MKVRIQIADVFKPLFEQNRYKVFYGGRGGAKSWAYAQALLLLGAREKKLILCTREFQGSIQDSVHRLLCVQIEKMGLSAFYEIQQTVIKGQNGTEIIFEGLKNNVTKIKSMEGVDIVWCEEAESITANSWDVLIPTIRKPNSEIWISFNPKSEFDATYKRFIEDPPTGAIVRKVSWRDNPWFPDELKRELEDCKAKDYDKYMHIWEGDTERVTDGAYYAKLLARAEEDGRVIKFNYEPKSPVHTAWDLGRADSTSIIFWQRIGTELRIIDHFEDSGESIEYYVRHVMRKPYIYGEHYAPHDVDAKHLESEYSTYDAARKLGLKFRKLKMEKVAHGIDAVRDMFPNLWINAECKQFIRCIRNYRHEYNDKMNTWKDHPLHDWSSHTADALRYMAMSMKEQKPRKRKQRMNLGTYA